MEFSGIKHSFNEATHQCTECNEHITYFDPNYALPIEADGWMVTTRDGVPQVTAWIPWGVKLEDGGAVTLTGDQLFQVLARLQAAMDARELDLVAEAVLKARKDAVLWAETATEAAKEADEARLTLEELERDYRAVAAKVWVSTN